MKGYKISELLYILIFIVSTIEMISIWDDKREKAYLFFGFAVFSLFMFFFRRHYRKKYSNRK